MKITLKENKRSKNGKMNLIYATITQLDSSFNEVRDRLIERLIYNSYHSFLKGVVDESFTHCEHKAFQEFSQYLNIHERCERDVIHLRLGYRNDTIMLSPKEMLQFVKETVNQIIDKDASNGLSEEGRHISTER